MRNQETSLASPLFHDNESSFGRQLARDFRSDPLGCPVMTATFVRKLAHRIL